MTQPKAPNFTATLDRTYSVYLPKRFDSAKSRQLLVSIAGQEGDFRHRWQVIDLKRPERKGPARGLLQFERGGGVAGVMKHPASRAHAQEMCRIAGIAFEAGTIWLYLEKDDAFAFGFGRLLLLTDPRPLPEIGHVWPAWDCYNRNWRPGKPHPDDWPDNYSEASRIIAEGR